MSRKSVAGAGTGTGTGASSSAPLSSLAAASLWDKQRREAQTLLGVYGHDVLHCLPQVVGMFIGMVPPSQARQIAFQLAASLDASMKDGMDPMTNHRLMFPMGEMVAIAIAAKPIIARLQGEGFGKGRGDEEGGDDELSLLDIARGTVSALKRSRRFADVSDAKILRIVLPLVFRAPAPLSDPDIEEVSRPFEEDDEQSVHKIVVAFSKINATKPDLPLGLGTPFSLSVGLLISLLQDCIKAAPTLTHRALGELGLVGPQFFFSGLCPMFPHVPPSDKCPVLTYAEWLDRQMH